MSHPELLLSNQVCFLVHRLDRAILARYRPMLDALGLTYPQYLVLLALWESDGQSIGSLCSVLDLDTGTVSPLIKRLTALGLVSKERRKDDERGVLVSLTAAGKALEAQALNIPGRMAACLLANTDEYHRIKASLEELLIRLDGQAGTTRSC